MNGRSDGAARGETKLAPIIPSRDRGGQDVKEEDDSQLSKRHCRAADLTQVQQRIIASGTLTVDEMNTFFLKKN